MVIILFSSNHCPACVALKDFLKKKNINFKEVNIENDDSIELLRQVDVTSVPTLAIYDEEKRRPIETYIGFNQREIENILFKYNNLINKTTATIS